MRKVFLLTLLPVAACARDQGDARLRPDAQPSIRVAEAAMAANAPEVALNVARNLLKTDPYNVPAQLAQAAALYAVGDLAQAATSYRTVLKVQPRSADAQLGMGRVFLARDEPREAEVAFRASLALEARAPAWSNLGIALDMQNRHGEAQAAYREALRLDPRNEGARSNLEISLAMAGGTAAVPGAAAGPRVSGMPAAGIPMRLSAIDPMAQPFAPEQAAARRRGRVAREAVPGFAPYGTRAPAFAAPELSETVQLVAMPSAPPVDATDPAGQADPAPVVLAASTFSADGFAPSAPDPAAWMVQAALSPSGQGLLAEPGAAEAVPRPVRRAAPRLPPAPVTADIPAEVPLAVPAPAPVTASMYVQPAVFQPPALPVATLTLSSETVFRAPARPITAAPAPAPAAPAVPAAAVRAPTPSAAPVATARPSVPIILASAPARAPVTIPAPAPAPVEPPAPRRLAMADRFDPAAVPMPVVPEGARPAPMAPLPPERPAAPTEGRWLRASR